MSGRSERLILDARLISIGGIFFMIQAYVFINAASSKAHSIYKALKGSTKVKHVHVVTGLHDLIAFVEAEDVNKLVKVITDEIQGVEGITKTVTCLAVGME